jgi:AcrR family transcriptional regulator
MTQAAEAGLGTVRERLHRGLLECLASMPGDDISEVTVEAVAESAGVSRATAYRHLGDRGELLYQAAIALAEAHITRCAAILDQTRTVAERVEEAFAYTVREASGDTRLQLLLRSPRADAIDQAIRAMTTDLMGPAIRAGQQDGQVRTDVPADDLLAWQIEQLYVVERLALSENSVRLWVRRFIIPALTPPPGAGLGHTAQLRAILDDTARQLEHLDRTVAVARTVLGDPSAEP